MTLSRAAAVGLAMLGFAPSAAAEPAAGGDVLTTWTEDATGEFYNRALGLAWPDALGSWIDADGVRQGSKPFASVTVQDKDAVQIVEIDVTDYVRAHGPDFFARRSGGKNIAFRSREAETGQPLLVVSGPEGISEHPAVADVSISRSYKSRGALPTLPTAEGFLIRFDPPKAPFDRAVLRLTTTDKQYGTQKIQIFRPDARAAPPTVPAPPIAGPRDILATWKGRDFSAKRENARIDGDVLTVWIPTADGLTAISEFKSFDGGGVEAYATVVMKLHEDWTPESGGKMPGLANTGMKTAPENDYQRSAWGGRAANGQYWSARTGFRAHSPENPMSADWTAFASYYYALDKAGFGRGLPWAKPVPKRRWFAYTQRVRLNEPDKANGELTYWLDGEPVLHVTDIRWRNVAFPESEIDEFWLDIYCGGTSCGPKVRATPHTVSIARVIVARAMPDPASVAALVAELNRAGK